MGRGKEGRQRACGRRRSRRGRSRNEEHERTKQPRESWQFSKWIRQCEMEEIACGAMVEDVRGVSSL
jgi:hypothetical protein